MTALTWKLEAFCHPAWRNITGDVITETGIKAKWGIVGNTFFDRVASTGTLMFSLRNSTGKYSPDHAGVLTGWKKSVPIMLTFTFDGVDYIRYLGTVDSINITPGIYGERRAYVTVTDWVDNLSKYPLTLSYFQLTKTADEAITTILNDIQSSTVLLLQKTTLESGENVFPTVFSQLTERTRAITEINKLINSEIGYLYVRKDHANGENLIFENASHRNGNQELSNIPLLQADCGLLELEGSTDTLGLESTTDGLMLNQTATFTLDNNMVDADIQYGKNIINIMQVTAYPKRIDTVTQTLFTLAYPLAIGAGETITIKGNYSDPSGGNVINVESTSMLVPVSGTDFIAWTNKDGTGTNITSDVSVIEDFGAQGFEYTITNEGTKAGYITTCLARGFGVYSYDRIMFEESNYFSYNEYGHEIKTLNQTYQENLYNGTLAARTVVMFEKDPRTVLKSISFWNVTDEKTAAFLSMDVGSIVEIKETQSDADGYYYIQAVNFTLYPNGLVNCTWELRQYFCLGHGLSLLAIEFVPLISSNIVDFGYIPKISDEYYRRTFSAWVYSDSVSAATQRVIVGIGDNGGENGVQVSFANPNAIYFFQKTTGATAGYRSATNSVPAGEWVNVIVSRDAGVMTNDPTIYINGVASAITVTTPQTDYLVAETGANLTIGNNKIFGGTYTQGWDGKITDVQIFDRVISAAEALAIYDGGIGGDAVKDGRIFQAPVYKTNESANYIDFGLYEGNKVMDSIHGYVGLPTGTPTGRALP